MDLVQFINEHQGKREVFDNENYRGQCTQICKLWALANGWPIPNSGGTDRAVDYKNFTNGYVFIENTRYGVPNRGDIVIWQGPWSEKEESKKYGHVGIFESGSTETFVTFEQNWPKGKPCQLNRHGYFGAEYSVIGWLHKTEPVSTPEPQIAPQATVTQQPVPKQWNYQFARNLYPGLLNDADVIQLQAFLQGYGLYPKDMALTGNYLAITKKAVANFQVQNNIVPNSLAYGAGYCGPLTRAFINK